jgi:hypothetical protein
MHTGEEESALPQGAPQSATEWSPYTQKHSGYAWLESPNGHSHLGKHKQHSSPTERVCCWRLRAEYL